MIAKLLYNLFAYPALSVAAHIAALFSPKLREGLRGRRRVAGQARAFRERNNTARVVLFHCASAGELEGIKPLAACCRERGFVPCVSYFSPSAKTALGPDSFAFADFSPFDSMHQVRAYLRALRPETVLISKHDVWPNLVWQCAEMKIPVWLINGNFRGGSFKRWPGARAFHRAIHERLSGILTVSEEHAERARAIAGKHVFVASVGDSRFDRVLARAREQRNPLDGRQSILEQKRWIIGGSTHLRDEILLLEAFAQIRHDHPGLGCLVVPHDPSESAVGRIEATAQQFGLTCAEVDRTTTAPDVLIVNRSGILADVYRYGTLAFVGGGFDRGVHSVIEPMAHGLAVICGPNTDVSREAQEAATEHLLFEITAADELVRIAADLLHQPMEDAARKFVMLRAGVVDRVLDTVLPRHAA